MLKDDLIMFKDFKFIKMFKHDNPMEPGGDNGGDDDFWSFLMFMRMMGKAIGALEDLILEINDLEKAKEKICYLIMNPEIDGIGLSEIPSRVFYDMVIVYAIPMKGSNNKMVATLVNNEMMNAWNVTENDLYNYARKNTPKLLVAKTDTCLDHSFIKEQEDIENCLIISNEQHTHGSTTILYEDFLKNIADENEGFMYVIPYSVEETVVIISNKKIDKKKLYSEIKKEKELILSSFVYEYNRETNQLELN